MKTIKLIGLFLVLMMLFSGCEKKVELKDDVYIIFTSDVHCGLEENLTFPGLKAYVDDLKAEHPYVTLVDTGDYLQGGTLGTVSKGEIIVDLMNQVGYDIVTYGNHDFDYGMERLSELKTKMEYETVASNVRYTGSGQNVFADVPEYIIKDYDGLKVAFIGVLTPSTIFDSTPKFFMENDEFVYDFYSKDKGQEMYDKIQSVVDEVRKQKVDYVIALCHLGSNPENAPYDSVSFIANTTGIDVVFDGHSHSLITEDKYPNKNGEDVILSSVGTKLQEVGQLIIGKDGSLTTMHISEYGRQDEKIAEAIAKANEELNSMLSEEVNEIDFDFRITDDEGIRMVRARETNLGDLVADAYRNALGTDIAVVNGGGVRANIDAGVISYGDLLTVSPFQNEVGSCYATGQDIINALEYSYRNTEAIYKLDGNAVAENGAFLQVSGLKLTIDTSAESPVLYDENEMFVGLDESKPGRVKDVYVLENGEYVPLDPAKTYSVASVTYVLFDNGDGNTAFSKCEPIIHHGGVDVELLKEYVKDLGTDIEKYRETDNRITVR